MPGSQDHEAPPALTPAEEEELKRQKVNQPKKSNALEEAKQLDHDSPKPIQKMIEFVFERVPVIRAFFGLTEPQLNFRPRNSYFNTPIPPEEVDSKTGKPKAHYATNKIRTTKYTPLNFSPKNILFQFQNVANIYFLLVAIFSAFTIFGTNNPGLASVPIIAIVVVTAIRDAVEDWRRKVSDAELNNTITTASCHVPNENSPSGNVGPWRQFKKSCSHFYHRTWSAMRHKKDPLDIDNRDVNDNQSIYSNATSATEFSSESNPTTQNGEKSPRFLRKYWKDVRVGDFVKVYADEGVPADMVVISSSDPEGDCFIDTRNLDGESNLKAKLALKSTKHLRRAKQLAHLKFHMEVEGASSDLNSFGWRFQDMLKEKMEPIGTPNFLPRGSTVRNSRWIIGYVVYTGVESKIVSNAGETPSKRSRLARDLNFYVACSFIFSFAMCFVAGVVEGVKFRNKSNFAYFFEEGLITKNPPLNGFVTFFASMSVSQNLVPISSYISIEIARTTLAFFIYSDYHIYDEDTDYPTTPKSWALSDDLGQIEFIFSDKTGTSTQNSMLFRKCTINGKEYGTAFTESMAGQIKRMNGDVGKIRQEMDTKITNEREEMMSKLDQMYLNPYMTGDSELVSEPIVDDLEGASGNFQRQRIEQFALTLALCNTVVTDIQEEQRDDEYDGEQVNENEPYGPGIFVDRQQTRNSSVNDITRTSTRRTSVDNGNKPVPTNLPAPQPEFAANARHNRSISSPRASFDLSKNRTSSDMPTNTRTSFEVSRQRGDETHQRKMSYPRSSMEGSINSNQRRSRDTSRVIGGYGRRSMSSARPKHGVDYRNMEGKVLSHKAESPDESALVKMARDSGYTLVEDGKHHKVVDMQGTFHRFEVLQTLLFTSSRKRMSIVVRNEAGRYFVLSKGADSMIASLLSERSRNSDVLKKTETQVERFGEEGLRTLMVAYKEIDPKFAEDWSSRYEAAAALPNRDEALSVLADEVECNLELLGGTGIEDQLQEDVPHTIEVSGKAGIKSWMSTGDKVETAISIGFSCNLLNTSMELLIVRSPEELGQRLNDMGLEVNAKTLKEAGRDHRPAQGKYASVIDGTVLDSLVSNHEYRLQFALLGKKCKSVLCCRVSPSQKAAVVYIMKTTFDVTTIAIGDGANDVSMIQVADVGIGIVGVEGRQAAMSADFAMGQFRFLQRLSSVHGRWSYIRVASMIETSFFENFMFSLTLFWYCIFNQMDQSFLYDYTYSTLFNSLFVSFPVVVRGIYDQDLPDYVLMKVPESYGSGISRKAWTKLRYFTTVADGIFESAVAFFFAYSIFFTGRFYSMDGKDIAFRQGIGILVCATSVFTCNTYVLLGQYRWDWVTMLTYTISCALIFAWTGIYSSFVSSNFFYWSAAVVYDTLTFWAYFLVSFVAAMSPRFAIISIGRLWFPSDVDIIREQWRSHKLDDPESTSKNDYDHHDEKHPAGNDNVSDTERAQYNPEVDSSGDTDIHGHSVNYGHTQSHEHTESHHPEKMLMASA